MSKLVPISGFDNANRVGDILFVHGLDGDVRETWQSSNDVNTFWPTWLGEDFPELAVWALDYDASSLGWKGTSMPLTDRAINVLAALDANGIGSRPVIFITHSLGGLVVKQFLRHAAGLGQPKWEDVLKNTKGLVFLSTPHSGSDIATWISYVSLLLKPNISVSEMRSHEPALRDLNLWFRTQIQNTPIPIQVYYEVQTTRGLTVVNATSADPGISGVIPVPIDASHITISKPPSREALIYQRLRSFVRDCFRVYPEAPGEPHTNKTVVQIEATPPSRNQPLTKEAVLDAIDQISLSAFPDSAEAYPKGTKYRPIGEANKRYYVLSRPSAALRAAIELMQKWHEKTVDGFPDCRVILDTGQIIEQKHDTNTALAGTPFSNLSFLEKDLPTGKIYITEAAAASCDRTMARFARHSSFQPQKGLRLSLFEVIFDDPRTVDDSALIHALFIAMPEAKEARERLFELFIVEYCIQQGSIEEISEFTRWCGAKHYPLLPRNEIIEILTNSQLFERTGLDKPDNGIAGYRLTEAAAEQIDLAKLEFQIAREECVSDVSNSIIAATGSKESVAGLDLPTILDEYLSAIFLEIRLLANYFRRGYEIFENTTGAFERFDYLIKQYLPEGERKFIEPWRRGFVLGLKKASENANLYIASVFHNVLATYYLNRRTSTSPYQEKRLRERTVYIDTNVLYALRVPASNYHEFVKQLVANLTRLGVRVKVFPFTIDEYEASLCQVERLFTDRGPDPRLVSWNPWLYQEFVFRSGKYLNRMSVCRDVHRINRRSLITTSDDFVEIENQLRADGVSLETDYVTLTDEEVENLWSEYSHKMPSDSWTLDEYWEFLYKVSVIPLSKKRHDVQCIVNVGAKVRGASSDELGPKAMLLTLDTNRLLRLRKVMRYIVGAQQLFEYFLPYMFLNDIPVLEASRFPNELLAAQLGTLLVKRPPKLVEVVKAYVRDSSIVEGTLGHAREFEAMAASINDVRLRPVLSRVKAAPEAQREELYIEIAEMLESIKDEEVKAFYKEASLRNELAEAKIMLANAQQRIASQDEQVEKMERKVRYWKSQSRGR